VEIIRANARASISVSSISDSYIEAMPKTTPIMAAIVHVRKINK